MSDFDTHELGEWLTAYLDGELDGAQRDVVERVLRESDEARRMLADLSDAAGSVAALPQHPAPDALLDDLRLQLERRDLLGDESDPRGSVPARSGWSVFSRWGLAAALGFAAVGGTWTIVDQMQDEPSTAITLATKESGKSASSDPEDNVGADAVPQQSRELTNSADIDVRLVSVLNFEQKLAAGLPQSALMDHQFDNERMRLSLQADSATDQSALNRKILDQLGELGMSDLGTVESAKLTEAPAGRVRVYLSGREGKNFEADATRQVLIRLPADEVPALYEQIERIAPRDDQIALQLEARSFDGKSRVSPTIQNLFGREDALPTAVASKGSGEPRPPGIAVDYGIFQEVVDILRDNTNGKPVEGTPSPDAKKIVPAEVESAAPESSALADARRPQSDDLEPGSREEMDSATRSRRRAMPSMQPRMQQSKKSADTPVDADDGEPASRGATEQSPRTERKSSNSSASDRPSYGDDLSRQSDGRFADASDESDKSHVPLVKRRLDSLKRSQKVGRGASSRPMRPSEADERADTRWVTLIIEINAPRRPGRPASKPSVERPSNRRTPATSPKPDNAKDGRQRK